MASTEEDRRSFLRKGIVAAGVGAVAPIVVSSQFSGAIAASGETLYQSRWYHFNMAGGNWTNIQSIASPGTRCVPPTGSDTTAPPAYPTPGDIQVTGPYFSPTITLLNGLHFVGNVGAPADQFHDIQLTVTLNDFSPTNDSCFFIRCGFGQPPHGETAWTVTVDNAGTELQQFAQMDFVLHAA